MEKNKKIFICLPINEKNWLRQEKRADELVLRIRKAGYVPVNPFDISFELNEKFEVSGSKPCHNDYLAEDIRELLECDGILLDHDIKTSDDCKKILAVAQAMAEEKGSKFTIFHTKEQWDYIKKQYII